MSRLMTSIAKFITGSPKTKPDGPVFVSSRRVRCKSGGGKSFDIQECKLHKLEKGPPTTASLTHKDAIRIFNLLTVLRRMETSAATLYKEKLIRGFCHLYSGQEAVAVGMKEAMRPVDTVITSYRCHGWTYLMGGTVQSVLSELTGRTTGCSRGKGGSMHMYAKNFYGGNGIVGAQVPLGAGIAFAHKYKGDGGVCFCLYGDGAANQGQFFEALNMAKLLNLPGVFICENNGYGMGTSVERHSASTEFYARGDYVPGLVVDGMDVLATREATKYCIQYCLSGKGPIVVEMVTYRYYGHSMSDPGTSYRSRKEVQEVRQTRDPITTFKKKLLDKGLVTADELKKPDGPVVVSSRRVRRKSGGGTSFDIQECKLHKLEKGPPTTASLTHKDAIRIFNLLTVLRRMETSAATLYKEKLIRGFCHLYSGQEAVAVGMKEAMRPVDTVITSYRCHGWTYLMGGTVQSVLSELTGRTTGCSRGKGGSMHMYAKNFYGGNGIVGAQVPLGAGIAFAHKYKGDGGVCFCLYGDGAANQGQFFEALNMAKLLNLPGVFICENNGYGMGTSVERHSASTEFYARGDYVPGLVVDGMDVLATREATKYCIQYCLSGKGPIVVEMVTYRYYGHSMSDPGTSYRSRKEVQEVRQTRDPITTFKKKLLDKGLVTAEELKKIEKDIRKTVDADAQKARTDPHADGKEVAADIYSQNLEANVRGCHPQQPYLHFSVQAKA